MMQDIYIYSQPAFSTWDYVQYYLTCACIILQGGTYWCLLIGSVVKPSNTSYIQSLGLGESI